MHNHNQQGPARTELAYPKLIRAAAQVLIHDCPGGAHLVVATAVAAATAPQHCRCAVHIASGSAFAALLPLPKGNLRAVCDARRLTF